MDSTSWESGTSQNRVQIVPEGSIIATAQLGVYALDRKLASDYAYAKAIDLFRKRMQREPDWMRTRVNYTHTLIKVICHIVEIPEPAEAKA